MIPADRLLHLFVSFVLALANPFLAAFAGIGKEVYDAMCGGMADVWDLVYDGVGILFGVLVSPIW
jgi:hypothetical protein